MSSRTNRKQKELSSLGILNVEKRAKQLHLNHAHNIFKNVCPSCLKIYLIEFNEYHIHTTRWSRFKYVTPKIKGIESETFYYHAIQDGYLLPDEILGWLLSTFN
jgi:hypothetical protein